MAAMAACRCMRQLRGHSFVPHGLGRLVTLKAPFLFEGAASSASSVAFLRRNCELVKSKANRACHIDTLAIVKRLESKGVPSMQAEAITTVFIEVLSDSFENISESFASKGEMLRYEMTQEAQQSKFQSEIEDSQGKHFSQLHNKIEKIIRCEVDKVVVGQRLDLNLEKGGIKDDLTRQGLEISKLTNKLDREIIDVKAQLEAAKFDVIKYCIGTLASISAVGLAFLRIMM